MCFENIFYEEHTLYLMAALQLPIAVLYFFHVKNILHAVSRLKHEKGYFTFMLNLVILNEYQVLKKSVQHMLCGIPKHCLQAGGKQTLSGMFCMFQGRKFWPDTPSFQHCSVERSQHL